MCPRSWVAATPVKYKRDIQQLTYVLAIVKNSENNGTEEISLVTPTPGDKPWPESVMALLFDLYIHHQASVHWWICASPGLN